MLSDALPNDDASPAPIAEPCRAAAHLAPCGQPDPDLNQPLPSKPNTAAGFALAPGIASLVGGFVFAGLVSLDPTPAPPAERLAIVLSGGLTLSVAFAFVGYATAAIVGVPVYLALPARARGCFAVVVPLAGLVAAAPWLLVAAPWRHGSADPSFLALPFGLGVVAGIAFLFLRRLPVVEAIGPVRPGEGASDP